MQKIVLSITALSLVGGLVFTSCRKKIIEDETPDVSTTEASVGTTQSVDSDDVDGNLNDAINDINVSFASTAGARFEENNGCGGMYTATLGTNALGKKMITCVYSGSCNGRTKSGTVIATLVSGTQFRDINAIFTIEFSDLKVTKNSKALTLNGIHTIKNLTGGFAGNVLTDPANFQTVSHSIRGNMTLKFDTTTATRIWSIARKHTWSNVGGILYSKIEGDTTIGMYSNLAHWGTNRFGNVFYTQLSTPVETNSACGWNRPTAGVRMHTIELSNGSSIISTVSIVKDSSSCANGLDVVVKNRFGKQKAYKINY